MTKKIKSKIIADCSNCVHNDNCQDRYSFMEESREYNKTCLGWKKKTQPKKKTKTKTIKPKRIDGSKTIDAYVFEGTPEGVKDAIDDVVNSLANQYTNVLDIRMDIITSLGYYNCIDRNVEFSFTRDETEKERTRRLANNEKSREREKKQKIITEGKEKETYLKLKKKFEGE